MPTQAPWAPDPAVPDDVPSPTDPVTAPMAAPVTAPVTSATGAEPLAPARWRLPLACVVVFAIAFAARLTAVLGSKGGLTGRFISYDTGVYYAAGDALSFGRLPYRDFTLLHPPGLPMFLVPFAWLGRLTTDHVGFVTAVVAFMVLGAVNAVLVTLVAHRMGAGPIVAALGGGFYAVWIGAVHAEYLVRLEPLGNLLVLLGLLSYLTAQRSGRRFGLVLAGAAFGAAASVKIWWAVPLLVLIAWQLARSRRHQLVPVTAGAAGALVVINGPFLLAAPSAMWHMVVADQLGRVRSSATLGRKLSYLVGTRYLNPTTSHGLTVGIILIAAVAVCVIVVAAWRRQAARLVVTLLLAQLAVLAVAPSWFGFYADYLTPAAAVTVAASIAPLRARRTAGPPGRIRPASVAAVGTVVIAAAATLRLLTAGNTFVVPFPSAQLTAAASDVRCLITDEPTGQIMTNTLSRGLRDGCPNWVDITGRTYGPDKLVASDGKFVPRAENPRWQRDLVKYLTSGNAVMLTRGWGVGASKQTLRIVRSGEVLADVDHYVIYHTRR